MTPLELLIALNDIGAVIHTDGKRIRTCNLKGKPRIPAELKAAIRQHRNFLCRHLVRLKPAELEQAIPNPEKL